MTRTVRVNRDRLWASLMELKKSAPTTTTRPAGAEFAGSRSPTPTREYSNPAACANGTDVLANAVIRLANQP